MILFGYWESTIMRKLKSNRRRRRNKRVSLTQITCLTSLWRGRRQTTWLQVSWTAGMKNRSTDLRCAASLMWFTWSRAGQASTAKFRRQYWRKHRSTLKSSTTSMWCDWLLSKSRSGGWCRWRQRQSTELIQWNRKCRTSIAGSLILYCSTNSFAMRAESIPICLCKKCLRDRCAVSKALASRTALRSWGFLKHPSYCTCATAN